MLEHRLEGPFNITPNEDIKVGEIPRLLNERGIRIPLKLLKFLLQLQWILRISHAPPSYLDFVAYSFVASNDKIKEFGFKPNYTTTEAFQSLRIKK